MQTGKLVFIYRLVALAILAVQRRKKGLSKLILSVKRLHILGRQIDFAAIITKTIWNA